jgi:hypothetical protein
MDELEVAIAQHAAAFPLVAKHYTMPRNLSSWSSCGLDVRWCSGTTLAARRRCRLPTIPFDTADVIYVNAGASRPTDTWLDRLNDAGRLILPLTVKKTLPLGATGSITRHGAVFRIERKGAEYVSRQMDFGSGRVSL